MKKLKKGFIPVMLTPFRDNGDVDFEALTRLTKFYISAGASALFANCLSSEMYELTPAEKVSVTKHVVDAAEGLPVVAAGNFGKTIHEQANTVKKIYETGVDAVVLITSLLTTKDEPNVLFEDRVLELIKLTDKIPLGFYECPVPYKKVITPEQLVLFMSTKRIIYYKDTCLDIALIKKKIAIGKGFHFGLYDAYMGHAVETLEAGAAGLSCIQGNFFPELIVWLCESYDDPAVKHDVQKVQRFLAANMDVMHHGYPKIAKYFLQKKGVEIGLYSRTGSAGFNMAVQKEIDILFTSYNSLAEDLNLQVAH